MALFKKPGIAKKLDDKTHEAQDILSDRISKMFGGNAPTIERGVQAGASMIGEMINPARQFGMTSAISGGAGKALASKVGLTAEPFDLASKTIPQLERYHTFLKSGGIAGKSTRSSSIRAKDVRGLIDSKIKAKGQDVIDFDQATPKQQEMFHNIIEGNVDEAAMIRKAGKTQITRGETAAKPVKRIIKENQLVDGDVLYIGAGKDFAGGKLLGNGGRKVTMTDPNVPKGAPIGFLDKPPQGATYDNVVSVFTAQTLQPAIRKGFFNEIQSHMKPGGQAIVAVRGTGGGIKGIRHQDGVVNLTKGTFQKPYTGQTLAEELGEAGFNVEIIQGAKSPSPDTVIAKLTLPK
jgi:hypothetical protein